MLFWHFSSHHLNVLHGTNGTNCHHPHLCTLDLPPTVTEKKRSESLLNVPQEIMELWLEHAVSVVQHSAIADEDPRTQVRLLSLCDVYLIPYVIL